MKNIITLVGVLFIAAFATGCTGRPLPLQPDYSSVLTPTPYVPTPTPGPGTPTAVPTPAATVVAYVKFTGASPGTTSSFPVHVWMHTGPAVGGTDTDVFNGTATLDSVNSYIFKSLNSNGYTPGTVSLNFNITAPSNQGGQFQARKIVSGVDSLIYQSNPTASQNDFGAFNL